MKKTTIVITGNNGYIGRVVERELEGYELILIDEENGTNIKDVVGLSADYLVHLAAYISVTESEIYPDKYYLNNCSYYSKFLKNNNFKKIIYASSYAIYNIDGSINPSSVYGDTKYIGEYISKRSCENITILRFANPVGIYDFHKPIINKIINGYPNVFWLLAKCKKNCCIFTIHDMMGMVRDFYPVSWISKIIKKVIENGIVGTYNIGSGIPTDVIRLLKNICLRYDIKFQYEQPGKYISKGLVTNNEIVRLLLLSKTYDPEQYCMELFPKYLEYVNC